MAKGRVPDSDALITACTPQPGWRPSSCQGPLGVYHVICGPYAVTDLKNSPIYVVRHFIDSPACLAGPDRRISQAFAARGPDIPNPC